MWLIPGWVYPSRSAARVKLLHSTVVKNARYFRILTALSPP